MSNTCYEVELWCAEFNEFIWITNCNSKEELDFLFDGKTSNKNYRVTEFQSLTEVEMKAYTPMLSIPF